MDNREYHIPPFISQYVELSSEWVHRGCGLVAMKIVLDYWNSINPKNFTLPLESLLQHALTLGAYHEGVGWSHEGLATVARSLGYNSFNRDLPLERLSITFADAFTVLADDIKKGPVLVSVWKNFDPLQNGGHIVVAYRAVENNIALVDPEKKTEAEGRFTMTLADFKSGYKMRSICVIPQSAVVSII